MATFLCECNDWGCREVIQMQPEELVRIRSLGKAAILSRRCPSPVVEAVIEQHNEFIVVLEV